MAAPALFWDKILKLRQELRRASDAVARRISPRRPVILMYHRIGEKGPDPWNLAVTPQRFAEQIAALASHRNLVPLERIASGHGVAGDVAITFDDGYQGVIDHALPVLDRHRCPATLFVVGGMVGSSREFWWDELSRLLIETPVTEPVSLALGDRDATTEVLAPASTAAERLALHARWWCRLQSVDSALRNDWIALLAERMGITLAPRQEYRIADAESLHGLVRSPLALGAHGMTHASLPTLDPVRQLSEIKESRDACKVLTGKAPEHFAYPFGAHDMNTVLAVARAGFSAAVTVVPRSVGRRVDPLRLPRIEVRDWDAATLLERLP